MEGPNEREENDLSAILDDWSGTGRGSHVEFKRQEHVPLVQGQFLGRGAMGDVYETTIKSHRVAWKRIFSRRKVSEAEKKEIEILKRLSHIHIVQLIGTYTQNQTLGLLIFPVAVCDLHTFFEDVEAYMPRYIELHEDEYVWRGNSLDEDQRARLTALHYYNTCWERHCGFAAYSRIGCLISAIAYLHDQNIRHKDLKPSNILLSPGHIFLSDFGSATDFSLLSQSKTDNERGTPRYFAPEVAAWKPNGRSADMFSLGCVLLEISYLHLGGTLKDLRDLFQGSVDTSFHANLGKLDKDLELILATAFEGLESYSPRDYHLFWEIRAMLARDPDRRPKARQLLHRIESCDSERRPDTTSIFGSCCRMSYISTREHENKTSLLEQEIQELKQEHKRVRSSLRQEHEREKSSLRQEIRVLTDEHERTKALLEEEEQKLRTAHESTESSLKAEIKGLKHKLSELNSELESLRPSGSRYDKNPQHTPNAQEIVVPRPAKSHVEEAPGEDGWDDWLGAAITTTKKKKGKKGVVEELPPPPVIPEPGPEPEKNDGGDWGFSAIWGGSKKKKKGKVEPESPPPPPEPE